MSIIFLLATAQRLPLAAESVHCIVTSPPYWGLRDYGLASSTWGGQAECGHVWGELQPGDPRGGSGPNAKEAWIDGGDGTGHGRKTPRGRFCDRCGAWLGCLGLEPSIELYVQHIVECLREALRVLREDGTCWLNIGDSYGIGRNKRQSGLKPKDLCMIPHRVALALQADGWYVRSDIVWAKTNPMPESVLDRPTRAHEYIFLLTKSERYWYAADAVREPHTALGRKAGNKSRIYVDRDPLHAATHKLHPGEENSFHPLGRNLRDVWSIGADPYHGAHFATFPRELARRCILAGCPRGGIVLDPFAGSGTVGVVALTHGRRAVMLDLKPEYVRLQRERLHDLQLALVPLSPSELHSIGESV